MSAPTLTLLPEPVWRARATEHARVVDALTAGRVARQRKGDRHPVEDFLFEYYQHRPAQLARWHPGPQVGLEGAQERAGWRGYRWDGEVATVDLPAFAARRGRTVDFVESLLRATLSRPGSFGCFGLHEWAMVYRADEAALRHTGSSLRLGREGTDAVVETHRLSCTHADAFRFFTDGAKPLNTLEPTRELALAHEQPGCLHAGMDVYKWCFKLAPAVPSDLTLDAFLLAREIRLLDMRASPYDLSALGLSPVPVETAEGKAAYAAAQRGFTARANALRHRLLAVIADLRPAA